MKSVLTSKLSTRAKALYLVLSIHFRADKAIQRILYAEIEEVFGGTLDSELIKAAATELVEAGLLTRERDHSHPRLCGSPYFWRLTQSSAEGLSDSERVRLKVAVMNAANWGPTGLSIVATAIVTDGYAYSACDWAQITGVSRRTWNRFRLDHGVFLKHGQDRPQLYIVVVPIKDIPWRPVEMIEIPSDEEVADAKVEAAVAVLAEIPSGDHDLLIEIMDAFQEQAGVKLDAGAISGLILKPWLAQRAKWEAAHPDGLGANFLRQQLHFLAEKASNGQISGHAYAFNKFSASLLERQAEIELRS